MKKILSVFLALVLVCSTLVLSGCKDSTKSMTDTELFNEALSQLFTPKMFEKLTESELFTTANHASVSVDRLDADFKELIGIELPTLPSVGLDFFRYGDRSFALEADMELDGEQLGAKLELKDGERFYLSLPDASDLYITASFEELLEQYDTSELEGISNVPGTIASLAEAFGKLDDVLLDGNLERSSDESEEVFDEEMSLECLTLTLDEKALKDVLSTVLDALPEGTDDELLDGRTLDELFDEAKLSLDAQLDFFFDGTALRLCTLSLDCDVDGNGFELDGRVELENSEKKFERVAELSLSADGSELMSLDSECSFELDGKELTGELSLKPTFADEEASSSLNSFELAADIDGSFSHEDFDIDAELELSVEGVALKIPMSFEGSYDKEHIELESTLDVSFMGTYLKLETTAALEKLDDLKSADYSDSDAITVDNADDRIDELAEDFAAYLMKKEQLLGFFTEISELFGDSQSGRDDDYDYDYDYDDDYYDYDDYFGDYDFDFGDFDIDDYDFDDFIA